MNVANGVASGSVNEANGRLAATTLAALGVVYGDIGTSPLYALRECFHGSHAVPADPANVLGILSLIIWALLIVISLKYLALVLRADNRGEGGILSMMTLIAPRARVSVKSRVGIITIIGLFGAGLLYGDGVITPAISVLSAIEGLQVTNPELGRYGTLITVAILVGLFMSQKHGTARIGRIFGPVILIWFVTLGLLGISGILREPAVLKAVNPAYAINFMGRNHWQGFVALGSIFLVVTGGEALYADLGHFGRKPIRLGWFAVALPGLLLQYLGQGALLLKDPAAAVNPFYLLAPAWSRYPLIALATMATIIASQAVITGAYSLAQQSAQLGYLPRLRIHHTSADTKGQIYVPLINWALMIGTIYLVLEFSSSSSLAAAYGIAVTTTMVITTLLLYIVMRNRWKWPVFPAVVVTVVILAIDFGFFAANTLKIPDGGWFPLALGTVIFVLMTTWKTGRRILAERLEARAIPLDAFMVNEARGDLRRIPGAAVFLTATSRGTPSAMVQNVKHNLVLHETNIILTIRTGDVPHTNPDERLSIEAVGDGFYKVTATYGFMESPDVPGLLAQCGPRGLVVEAEHTTFFLGRETLIASSRPGMALWREHLFAFMARNAQRATDYFRIPANRAIEIGTVVEM